MALAVAIAAAARRRGRYYFAAPLAAAVSARVDAVAVSGGV